MAKEIKLPKRIEETDCVSDEDFDDVISLCEKEATASDIQHTQQSKFSSLHSRLTQAGCFGDGDLKKYASHRKGENIIVTAQSESSLYDPNVQFASSMERPKAPVESNVGKGWFNIEPAVMTEDLKRDIKIIQMRNYLDSKRFYKNPDRTGTVLHVGTVIGGSGDSKSSRLTHKERKASILDEVLANKKIKKYSKDKYMAIQKEKSNKRKTFKKSTSSKRTW